jgi:hypothetical protein
MGLNKRKAGRKPLLENLRREDVNEKLILEEPRIYFERIGVRVSRQDMANWQAKIGIILISLYVLLKETVKGGDVLRYLRYR